MCDRTDEQDSKRVVWWQQRVRRTAIGNLTLSYNSQSGKVDKAPEGVDGSRRKKNRNVVDRWGIRGDGCAGTVRRGCETICDCKGFGIYVCGR